jgi:hypothetical protein
MMFARSNLNVMALLVCCDKHRDQKQLGEQMVFLMLHLHHTGCQGRSSRQELKQRPQKTAAYWPAVRVLSSSLSSIAQDHMPRDGTTHSGLGHLPSIIINKMSNRFTL